MSTKTLARHEEWMPESARDFVGKRLWRVEPATILMNTRIHTFLRVHMRWLVLILHTDSCWSVLTPFAPNQSKLLHVVAEAIFGSSCLNFVTNKGGLHLRTCARDNWLQSQVVGTFRNASQLCTVRRLFPFCPKMLIPPSTMADEEVET